MTELSEIAFSGGKCAHSPPEKGRLRVFSFLGGESARKKKENARILLRSPGVPGPVYSCGMKCEQGILNVTTMTMKTQASMNGAMQTVPCMGHAMSAKHADQ